MRKIGFYEKYVKRSMDFILSLCAVVLLSPVLFVTALLVKMKLGSPVIFRQKRPGKDEKIFEMFKFRSMTDSWDEKGNLLPDEVRLTSFGRKLRATSLDELPELFNILKGDMSIVGPRPLLVRDMVFMTKEQRIRHKVLPGLTGLAQVNGRNGITWERKLELDQKYVSKITFISDLKVIFYTVEKVIKQSDVVREGTVSDMDLGDWLLSEGKIVRETYDNKQREAKQLLNE